MSAESRRIVCDCCGKQLMAIRRGDKIVIEDRRHGQRHYVVIDLQAELTKPKSACSNSDATQGG